jgi:hypothetical protein
MDKQVTSPGIHSSRCLALSTDQALALRFDKTWHRTASSFIQCRSQFASSIPPLRVTSFAPIFGSLFHALTFSVTLTTMVESQSCRPGYFPPHHHLVLRHIQRLPQHRSSIRQYALRRIPITKVSFWNQHRRNCPTRLIWCSLRQNEEYNPSLPSYPDAVSEKLEQTFVQVRSQTQGMLLAYLNGTATWELGDIKLRV